MSSAWSKVFRGIAKAAEGLADLSDGAQARAGLAAPADFGGPEALTERDRLKELLSALAQRMASCEGDTEPPEGQADAEQEHRPQSVLEGITDLLADPGSSSYASAEQGREVDAEPITLEGLAGAGGPSSGLHTGAEPTEGVRPGDPPGAPPDDRVISGAEFDLPLQECPELDRQRKERRRRAKFRQDPVQALSAASYWLAHLVEQPLRAEELTRCVECLPGSASERFNRALQLGMSELQLYATYYDECLTALQRGKDKAEQLARYVDDADAGEAINTLDLLDADRIGRVLFWLGDRPDVDALTDAPPATADVRYFRHMGPDHIEGPRGTVQTSAAAGKELPSLEELEEPEEPEARVPEDPAGVASE